MVLVELDELSSGVPIFLKSDNGKLLRNAIIYLVTWVSHVNCPATASPAVARRLQLQLDESSARSCRVRPFLEVFGAQPSTYRAR